MSKFNLTDQYVDAEAERSLLAAISENPDLYWELKPQFVFFESHKEEADKIFQELHAENVPPDVPDGWTPADDPEATLGKLRDSWQRRHIASLQEDLGSLLQKHDKSSAEMLEYIEHRTSWISGKVGEGKSTPIYFNDRITGKVLEEAREARDEYQATGDPIRGIKTGISQLDEITGGLQPGLTIISGGPGVGKTTLALQVASDAAAVDLPTLYISFENSPRQLVLKGMGRVGDVNPQSVRRGTVPIEDTRLSAKKWKQKAHGLGFIEGRSDLSPDDIIRHAEYFRKSFSADRCLIVVDYLQLYAKATEELQGLDSLRERVEQMGQRLREISMQLDSPVLAISSQSRAAGYSSGGSADLENLFGGFPETG